MSKPELLKFALERRVKSLGITRKLDGGKIMASWADVVGPQLASHTEPQSFENGVLTVAVPDSAWRHELSFSRQELVERLNAALGSRAVKDIYLVAVPRRKDR